MKKIVVLFLFLFVTNHLIFSQKNDSINPALTSKFIFNAGIFIPSKRVKFGFKSSGLSDDIDIINFDKALKLSNLQSSFLFDVMWRFSRQRYWSVTTSFFRIRNSKHVKLEEDIQWNDLTFKAGTGIKGGFSMSIYKIFFGRVITKGPKHEIGGGLGIHAFVIQGYIEGLALVNENEFKYEKSNISSAIPLPNIGLWFIYAPHHRLAFSTRVDWFGLSIDEYSGSLWNANAGINYRIFKSIGLNLSYKYQKIKADVNKRLWQGSFYMRFQGPVLTVTGSF